MNVAGGMGGQVGDLPIYISAIRSESAVAKSGRIQVNRFGCVREGGREGGGGSEEGREGGGREGGGKRGRSVDEWRLTGRREMHVQRVQ